MRVQDIMTKSVETVRPGVTAQAAWEKMQLKAIHHLVVLDDGKVVGILSDRDLGGSRGTSRRRNRTVADLMSTGVATARPETTIRQAANRLRGRTIGCLPVLKGRKLVGIITVSDLLELIGQGLDRKTQASKRTRKAKRRPQRKR